MLKELAIIQYAKLYRNKAADSAARDLNGTMNICIYIANTAAYREWYRIFVHRQKLRMLRTAGLPLLPLVVSLARHCVWTESSWGEITELLCHERSLSFSSSKSHTQRLVAHAQTRLKPVKRNGSARCDATRHDSAKRGHGTCTRIPALASMRRSIFE